MKTDRLERDIQDLNKDLANLRTRLGLMEREHRRTDAEPVLPAAQTQPAAVAPMPLPPIPAPIAAIEKPAPLAQEEQVAASKITGPIRILPPQPPEVPAPVLPVPPPLPVPPVPVAVPSILAVEFQAHSDQVIAPEPAPELKASLPVTMPTLMQAPCAPLPAPKPASRMAVPLPPAPRPAPEAPRRNLEDILGKQLFLKMGVAILVIGVVFAMGLVFQMVGPWGKVLMGYGTGLGLLGTGMAFERKETFRTFGRALIAGSWGILYFVTFAAGFVDASRVFQTKPVAILALLVAGSAAVGYSLRYRHEWTTLSAFLLIHLSLGVAAYHLAPSQNLLATLIVALAIAVLVWRTGWVRLLGLGVPATWASLALWMLPRAPGDLSWLPVLVLVALAFQAAILLMEVEEEGLKWLGLAQAANFLAPFALCLRESMVGGSAWMWALGFGLAFIGFAFAQGRKRRHGLFLLTATEALVALAFVTPLRLGLQHDLTPTMRLLGLELLLAAGVFLRERYFRFLAYLGFGITLLELGVVRLGMPGPGRTLLLGAAALVFLLDTFLARTWWEEPCAEEMPSLAWGFSLAGTLCLAVLLGLELPHRWLPPAYAALAVLWTLLALSRGLSDLAVEASTLAVAAGVALLVLNQVGPPPQGIRILSAALTGGTLAVAYLASRLWPEPRTSREETTLFRGLFSVLALGCGALLVLGEVPAPWPPPILIGSGLLLLGLGLLLHWSELTVEGLALGPVALLTAFPHLEVPGGSTLHLSKRAWMLGLLAAGALGKELLLRTWGTAWPWTETAKQAVMASFGLAGALLLAGLVFLEVPAAFVAASLMTLGLLWLLWSRWQPSNLRCGTAYGFLALGFLALATHAWGVSGTLRGIPWRVVAFSLALLPAFLAEWQLRVLSKEFSAEGTCLADRMGEENLDGFGRLVLVLASAALVALVFTDAPARLMPLLFVLLGGIYLLWARPSGSALRCYLSVGYMALGFLTMGTHAWWVGGSLGAVPARLAFVGMPLLLAYGIQYLYHRAATEAPSATRDRLVDLVAQDTLPLAAMGTLLACSGVLGLLVKMEALAHGKNLLVGPAWALAGVLYLERGRALRNKAWRLQGHLWMALAFAHFLAVNLMQPGDLGGLSLRLATGIPFLGLYLYTYLTWEDAAAEPASLQGGYFYAIQLAVALLVLYELHRAWVLPAWALQGLLSLGWGLRRATSNWLRAAMFLAVATLVRGAGTNLVFRDTQLDFRLNWITVPLAVALLLAGYVALNRHREKSEAQGAEGLGAGYSRLPWFAAQAILLFGFIWVEVSGTELTVWLSAYGLGMVVLGFMLQERVARLTGLGMLSACILKLFFYDLRGLTGLPRVLSFIVLGLVLIAVSYTYTRFKDRLEQLL